MDRNQFTNVLSKINLVLFACLVSLILLCPFGITDLTAQTYSGKSSPIEIKIQDPELVEKTVKPTIRWVYPAESMESVGKEEINLKLGISSISPVVKVTLIVNNEVVEVFENFTQSDPGYLFDAWLEKSVHLRTGSNDIQLIVQNQQGALKHQRKIEVEMSAEFRNDHALIFAIDEYDSWNSLQGPVRDAEKIARVLEDKGFNIEIVRNFTTFELLGKLEEYVVEEFQTNDQLFIYFAGHGSMDEATGEGYFVCKNSVNLQNANSTYISYSVIKSIVNNIPAQHIFILVDAVKGQGEPLSSVLAAVEGQASDSTVIDNNNLVLSDVGKTRIGILSGTTKYLQGPAYNAGSDLSRAFITYLRKSELSDQPSWGDLLREFQHIDPIPIYVEFGDHSPGNGFTFKKSTSEN
jgi:hypothetical protein